MPSSTMYNQSGNPWIPIHDERRRMPDAFELRIRIEPDDIDELGHVNNVVYLKCVQDIAVAHWTAEATPDEQASLFGVVTRHEIDYLRPAFPSDEIVARTWVGAAEGRRFDRHTEVRRVGP